ncbi:Lrp/AsnC family transcriptional regulator [Candidatus Woesearchaeota archaeon]|nr:Lrp/AsnC family transcriptional regulator [Candidatus Woesearchaeota archaeon]
MSIKLDKVDKKLLFELDRNARQSYQQIAKKLRVSKDVVMYRAKRLEKEKVICGYYTLIDFSKLGYFIVRVYLKLQHMTPELEEKFIIDLVKNQSIFTVYKTEGEWDIAMGFIIQNFDEFYKAWEQVELKYKKYIFDRNMSILFEYTHYYRNYLVEKSAQDYTAKITGNSAKEDLDNKDILLLSCISSNARIPVVKLSRTLNLNASSVIYKIKKLEKKEIILGYRAMIDFGKLGYEYYKVDVNIADITKRRALRSYLQMHPNVVYEDITIGGSDVEFDLEVKNPDEFYSFMEELKRAYPLLIGTYSYYKARKIYKYLYMPELLQEIKTRS